MGLQRYFIDALIMFSYVLSPRDINDRLRYFSLDLADVFGIGENRTRRRANLRGN